MQNGGVVAWYLADFDSLIGDRAPAIHGVVIALVCTEWVDRRAE